MERRMTRQGDSIVAHPYVNLYVPTSEVFLCDTFCNFFFSCPLLRQGRSLVRLSENSLLRLGIVHPEHRQVTERERERSSCGTPFLHGRCS